MHLISDHRSRSRNPNRLRWLRSLALIAFLLYPTVGLPVHLMAASQTDPFYEAPSDLPSTPGALLRHESFERGLPEHARADRILYTTTGLDGAIRVASALVIQQTAPPVAPRPVLLWAHGATGIAQRCAPSLLDEPLGGGAMPAQQEAIDAGWVVVAPDYIGLGTIGPHPFLVGQADARSALDAVRAVR